MKDQMRVLTALQAYELKLENILRRYLGKVELSPGEFLKARPTIKARSKAAKLRAEATRIAKSAHNDLADLVPGQRILSTRDRNKRDKAGDKMRRARELFDQADAIERSLIALSPV